MGAFEDLPTRADEIGEPKGEDAGVFNSLTPFTLISGIGDSAPLEAAGVVCPLTVGFIFLATGWSSSSSSSSTSSTVTRNDLGAGRDLATTAEVGGRDRLLP